MYTTQQVIGEEGLEWIILQDGEFYHKVTFQSYESAKKWVDEENLWELMEHIDETAIFMDFIQFLGDEYGFNSFQKLKDWVDIKS